VSSPPMTTVASGRCTSAPAPVEIAIGMKPRLATRAVITTGRRRVAAPSRTASSISFPACWSSRIYVKSTTPLRTAIPNSAMNPTP